MTALLDYIRLNGPDGEPVELQLDGYRHINSLDGLQGVQTRTSIRTRPSQHGSISLTKFRADRVITASGVFIGDDAERAWQEYHTVSRALAGAVDTDRLLQYSIGGLELQMFVRCEEIQAPIQVSSRAVATQYVLRASDPRAYSQSYSQVSASASTSGGGGLEVPFTFPFTFGTLTGSSVQVTNAGTVGSPAIITLAGYLLDPIVRLGSRQIAFDGTILTGDEVVIDLGTRDVYLNGSPGIHLLNFAETTWFEIPPGTSVVELFQADSDGSASITVALSDAYQ